MASEVQKHAARAMATGNRGSLDFIAPAPSAPRAASDGTGRSRPETGELFVLWDGNGLVVKRIEAVPGREPPRLRLLSANPGYEPYTCLAEDAHIVGKVIWTPKRM